MPEFPINPNDRRAQYTATAGQTIFPYDFPIFADSELTVYRTRAGVTTILVLSTDYVVSGVAAETGGNVALSAGALLDDVIAIVGTMPNARTTDFQEQGDFRAEVINRELDRTTIQLQEMRSLVNRTLRLDQFDDPQTFALLPTKTARAGLVLGFDSNGNPTTFPAVGGGSSASQISFLQAGTGAVGRTVESKLRELPTPYDYGAIGDATVDDTQALKNWLARGGFLYFAPGRYRVTDALLPLLIDKPTVVIGAGRASEIVVDAGVGASTDVLKLKRAGAGQPGDSNPMFWALRDFAIMPASNGIGRHAIEIDTTGGTTAYLQELEIKGIQVGSVGNELGGNAVHLTKHASSNTNLFASKIHFNILTGGVNLNGCGDSVWVRHNILTGTKRAVYIEPIAGAFQQVVSENNITARGGAIHLKGSGQVAIENNQIELLDTWTGDSNRALVVIENANRCRIVGNNVNPELGSSDGADCIRFIGTSAKNQVMGKNRLVCDSAGGFYHVKVAAGAALNEIWGDNYYENPYLTEVAEPVVDNQDQTIGVWKALSLLNSWVALSTGGTLYEGLFFKINPDRSVTLRGWVGGGTNSAGTAIASGLPVGGRPAKTYRIPALVIAAGVWSARALTINPSGSITIPSEVLPATTAVGLDNVTFSTF